MVLGNQCHFALGAYAKEVGEGGRSEIPCDLILQTPFADDQSSD